MEVNTYDWIMSDGYWIMPNKVLFDKNLSDKQKLLYCLISSLCAEKGYCWATNDYLSEKVDCTKNNITKMVKKLCDEGYITIEINKEYGNQRKLRVASIIQKDYPIIPKDYTPIIPKDYHNNISNNNIIPTQQPIITDSNSLNSKTSDGKKKIPQLDNIKNSDDIRDILSEDEISQKKLQLKILLKMVDLWYKVKKTKNSVLNELDWLKAKANLYNIKQPDGNIAWMTFYQKIDKRYDWHVEKNKPVKNFKTSIVPFISK